MTRDRLLELAEVIEGDLRLAQERLASLNGPSYDEEYKVQEWHPKLTEEGLEIAAEHLRQFHVALTRLGLFTT